MQSVEKFVAWMLEKQLYHGDPPRPGLQWDPLKHRWTKPPQKTKGIERKVKNWLWRQGLLTHP